MAASRRPLSAAESLPVKRLSDGQQGFPVVGIGASAGGLDACRKLLSALPSDTGMAFILVQHLDPTHESMMVDLLAGSTSMTVVQAMHGMKLEINHLYVIPPAYYLSVEDGRLVLSHPGARHGTRMPFDFLLNSLAESCGSRAVCIVLSGTGADGSIGLKAISDGDGLILAQDPDEAAYDGMPRSAILTGLVDRVLSVSQIPLALLLKNRQDDDETGPEHAALDRGKEAAFLEIIALVRDRTSLDFSLYKSGTLERRITRRMGMIGCEDDMDRYLGLLREDQIELDQLAKDLLIHVTSFFRDPAVFDYVAEEIIPDLIANASVGEPIRIWIAGCSTGEETYTLAMLFREKLSETKRNITFQLFASDIDPDAIAFAREGLYPASITNDVSPERLARFFSFEDHAYRVKPELRDSVLFTVQDVLVDPPFSRLDLVSCRNLLIYLRTEAQAQVISQFHFALRFGGILLLGNSETISKEDSRFGVVSKPQRIFRHIGHRRPGEFGLSLKSSEMIRPQIRRESVVASSRQEVLADLCQRVVVEKYAPATIVINHANECLYTLGPTDRYLRVANGYPTLDVLAMVRRDLRTKLRSAIHQAQQMNNWVVVASGKSGLEGDQDAFSIVVEPFQNEGEKLLLISFLEQPKRGLSRGAQVSKEEASRVAELAQELELTRTELEGAILNLENSSQEQKAINQEALSMNEEYQSTNEELVTSKEELQSLNEELSALNSQLQETLERQRTTSDDLQNILYSTNVATLFLDMDLRIRFFTPATKELLNIIAGDIGRPIADLSVAASDTNLRVDSQSVIQTHDVVEREILFPGNKWYLRRILPYRTEGNGVEGVVITFSDITERKHVAEALKTAMEGAEQANIAKTRFLAVASHDLRQPLQTSALLQGILSRTVKDPQAQKLIARLDETLSSMSAMLNALLDINGIEAGTVQAEKVDFPIEDLIARMRNEFSFHARAKGLGFRTVSCRQVVNSDPRLMEQVIRNLLSNALKYTNRGKILLGCRRHTDFLRLEVLDTGIGIAEDQLNAIFDEYHQIGNVARDRAMGLGLGLAIVQRLGSLLGHQLNVRSLPNAGSVFSIDIPLAKEGATSIPVKYVPDVKPRPKDSRKSTILIVENDADVRDLMDILLTDEGYYPIVAPDAVAALKLQKESALQPDLIIADYNLPNGINGIDLITTMRDSLNLRIPAILLTGDISTDTLRQVMQKDCLYLSKPIKANELSEAITNLLTSDRRADRSQTTQTDSDLISDIPKIYVVDDDRMVRDAIRSALEKEGNIVEGFSNCEDFLAFYRQESNACLLIDSHLPGMQGLELLQRLHESASRIPAIMITGNGDVATAVNAMKAGARDFIEKPINYDELVASIDRALTLSRDIAALSDWRENASERIAGLTDRQREIMDLVLAGYPSKNIAADLNISQRTVENHRAAIMKKTGVKSLPALARLATAAAVGPGSDPSSVTHQWNN